MLAGVLLTDGYLHLALEKLLLILHTALAVPLRVVLDLDHIFLLHYRLVLLEWLRLTVVSN